MQSNRRLGIVLSDRCKSQPFCLHSFSLSTNGSCVGKRTHSTTGKWVHRTKDSNTYGSWRRRDDIACRAGNAHSSRLLTLDTHLHSSTCDGYQREGTRCQIHRNVHSLIIQSNVESRVEKIQVRETRGRQCSIGTTIRGNLRRTLHGHGPVHKLPPSTL